MNILRDKKYKLNWFKNKLKYKKMKILNRSKIIKNKTMTKIMTYDL